jgi:hypothetical protein
VDADAGLSPEQLQELKAARERAGGIRAAGRVAAFNAWTLGILAGITALFGLTSIPMLALAAGMGWVARNEWHGRALLLRFDPSGPTLLTRNQLGLLVLAVVYCTWRLAVIYLQPNAEWDQLQELLDLEPGSIRDVMATGYAAAIVLAGLFVGLNARYYARRGPMMTDYLRQTPTWAVEILRASSPE